MAPFVGRSRNLPPYTLSESKALAKRKETSPAVSTVEAVAMSMQQRGGAASNARRASQSAESITSRRWTAPKSSTRLRKSKSSARLRADLGMGPGLEYRVREFHSGFQVEVTRGPNSQRWRPSTTRWASHIFISRRHYRNAHDTKGGKRRETNARLSFSTACELGFRGSLDEWERLMGAVAHR